MKVYLGVFLGYKDNKAIRENLLEFNTIKELDEYTKNYEKSIEIKRVFRENIEELIMYGYDQAKKGKGRLVKENKDGKPIVYLSAYTENEHGGIKFIDVMYKNRKEIVFLKIDELIHKILFVIRRIKKYDVVSRSGFEPYKLTEYLHSLNFLNISFTRHEIDFLKRYIETGNEKDLDNFKKVLKRDLLELNDNKLYGMLRFNEIDLKKYTLFILEKYNMYRLEEEEEQTKRLNDNNQFVSDCDDDYFKELVNNEEYEKLFNNYDLDEIMRYSGDKENPLGVRRK